MTTIEGAVESGISNRRVYLSTEQLVEMWRQEKPKLQRSVSVSEALVRPPKLYSEHGLMTPQGWILSKAVPFKEELQEMTQQQADELMAHLLRHPRSMAVLARHLMNLHPGKGLTRRESVVYALTKPEYFLGDCVRGLKDLALRVDGMTKTEWEDIQEKYFDLKSQTSVSLLGSPLAVQLSSPLDLTKMTSDAFRVGAKYASLAAFGLHPAEFKASFVEPVVNDVFVASGWASLEVLHRNDLQAQGHKFVYEKLFIDTQKRKLASTTLVEKQPKPEKIKVTQDEYELYGMNQRGPTIASRHFITVSEAKRPTLLTRKQRVGQIIRVTAQVAVLVSGLSLVGVGVADVFWGVRVAPDTTNLEYLRSITRIIDSKMTTNLNEVKITKQPENIARLQKELDILVSDRQIYHEEINVEKKRLQPQEYESGGRVVAGLLMGGIGLVILFKRKIFNN